MNACRRELIQPSVLNICPFAVRVCGGSCAGRPFTPFLSDDRAVSAASKADHDTTRV